jgi:cytochrome c oxidase assembly protein subunit 11
VTHGLSWVFKPVQHEVDADPIGEHDAGRLQGANTGSQPVTGTATFNVTPQAAGAYFNKIDCFCFTEQTLQPGESADMPVVFFIDPDIVDSRNSRTFRRSRCPTPSFRLTIR